MKSYAVAGLLLVGLATPALAASQHYAVKDTVGNCSVIDARPSANLRLDCRPYLKDCRPYVNLDAPARRE